MARPRKSATQPPAKTPSASAPKDDAARVDAVADPLPGPRVAKDTEPNKGGRPSNAQKLTAQIESMTVMLGSSVALFAPLDGVVIVRNASEFAEALGRLAEVNPRIRKLLEGSINGSAWAGVVIVTAKIGMEIARNHGTAMPGAELVFGSGPVAPVVDLHAAGTNGKQ